MSVSCRPAHRVGALKVWRTLVGAHRRFRQVRGNTVAAALALNSFLALFPALVVTTAVVGFLARSGATTAAGVTNRLGLHGSAAELVAGAVESATRSAPAASVVGALGLAWAGLGVFAALDQAFNAVWATPSRGVVARLAGLVWLAGATVVLGASAALSRIGSLLPAVSASATVLAGVAVDAVLFAWSSRVFVARPMPWRARLPGALTFAAGMAILKPAGAIAVPRMVASSSALYGTIGAVFAVLVWLTLLARLVVFAATLNATLADPPVA